MKPEILSVATMYGPSMERLEREFTVHKLWQAPDKPKFIADVGAGIRGIQGTGSAAVPASLIDSLPKLEIISCFGVGYDGVDIAAAQRRKIIVTNTPDVLNDCVADTAFGLLIAASRGIALGDRFVRAGKWLSGNLPLHSKVSGKRLGIVGMGRIGRVIAKRASGFDMSIAYHSRRRVPDLPFVYYDRLVELREELRLPRTDHSRRR